MKPLTTEEYRNLKEELRLAKTEVRDYKQILETRAARLAELEPDLKRLEEFSVNAQIELHRLRRHKETLLLALEDATSRVEILRRSSRPCSCGARAEDCPSQEYRPL